MGNDETKTQKIEYLLDVMRILRDPLRGCPWDKEQNFASVVPYTIEEAYEVEEAIRKEDFDELIDYKYEYKKDVYTHMDVERFSALAYLFSMGLGVKNLSVLKSMSDRGVGFFETFFKFSDNDPDEIKLSVEKFSEIIGSYILEDL